MSPSVIAPLAGIIAVSLVPAIFAHFVLRKASKTEVVEISECEFSTAWWSFGLLVFCIVLGLFLIFLGVRAGSVGGRWFWGGSGVLFLLFGIASIAVERRNVVSIKNGNLNIKEGFEKHEIDLKQIKRVDVSTYFVVVEIDDKKISFKMTFSKPWELLAMLRLVVAHNHGQEAEKTERSGVSPRDQGSALNNKLYR